MNTVLIDACENGDFETVEGLLENTTTYDVDDLLRTASVYGHLDIVELLVIKAGANIDDAIIGASYDGQLDIVKLLINSGANVHADDDLAIAYAASNGHIETVKLLINSGVMYVQRTILSKMHLIMDTHKS
jgi:ankyrin repeat protein